MFFWHAQQHSILRVSRTIAHEVLALKLENVMSAYTCICKAVDKIIFKGTIFNIYQILNGLNAANNN